MRYLELNAEGVVVNFVIWDGISHYEPVGIAELLPCDEHPGVSFGWQKIDGEWHAPTPEEVMEE